MYTFLLVHNILSPGQTRHLAYHIVALGQNHWSMSRGRGSRYSQTDSPQKLFRRFILPRKFPKRFSLHVNACMGVATPTHKFNAQHNGSSYGGGHECLYHSHYHVAPPSGKFLLLYYYNNIIISFRFIINKSFMFFQ